MKTVMRRQFRGALRNDATPEMVKQAAAKCRQKVEQEQKKGRLLTCAMFRYRQMVFAYLEEVNETENVEDLFADLQDLLLLWPQMQGQVHWAEMYQVFWFDQPVSLEQWRRKTEPTGRCGRIAVLHPDKLFSYVCHHQAIVREGLLVGDRYQCIALHENILFSYFETPRDREQVNIRREEKPSREIEAWSAVDPESHFYHFPEAGGDNFMVIPALFTIG